MFRDPLIRKAWQVRRQAEGFPLAVLLEAAAWLEEKYRKAPSQEVAVALALQYFVLAMRQPSASPTVAKEYFLRAMRCCDKAARAVPTQRQLPASPSLN
jgi:hypothetical protein